jgi:hypothetical protein
MTTPDRPETQSFIKFYSDNTPIMQCANGHSFLGSGNPQCPWCELAALRAELDKFVPLDGNRNNTALENWFPFSAEGLKEAQADLAACRKELEVAMVEMDGAGIPRDDHSDGDDLTLVQRVKCLIQCKDDSDDDAADAENARIVGEQRAAQAERDGWNKAVEEFSKLCDEADKSTHPADLADRIRAKWKETI